MASFAVALAGAVLVVGRELVKSLFRYRRAPTAVAAAVVFGTFVATSILATADADYDQAASGPAAKPAVKKLVKPRGSPADVKVRRLIRVASGLCLKASDVLKTNFPSGFFRFSKTGQVACNCAWHFSGLYCVSAKNGARSAEVTARVGFRIIRATQIHRTPRRKEVCASRQRPNVLETRFSGPVQTRFQPPPKLVARGSCSGHTPRVVAAYAVGS